jgi:hypothetical protein
MSDKLGPVGDPSSMECTAESCSIPATTTTTTTPGSADTAAPATTGATSPPRADGDGEHKKGSGSKPKGGKKKASTTTTSSSSGSGGGENKSGWIATITSMTFNRSTIAQFVGPQLDNDNGDDDNDAVVAVIEYYTSVR